jgi:hypothetical protein
MACWAASTLPGRWLNRGDAIGRRACRTRGMPSRHYRVGVGHGGHLASAGVSLRHSVARCRSAPFRRGSGRYRRIDEHPGNYCRTGEWAADDVGISWPLQPRGNRRLCWRHGPSGRRSFASHSNACCSRGHLDRAGKGRSTFAPVWWQKRWACLRPSAWCGDVHRRALLHSVPDRRGRSGLERRVLDLCSGRERDLCRSRLCRVCSNHDNRPAVGRPCSALATPTPLSSADCVQQSASSW